MWQCHISFTVQRSGSQGHWIENGMQEGGRGRSPYSSLAANRKVNEIGTEIEKGAWGCNNYCM